MRVVSTLAASSPGTAGAFLIKLGASGAVLGRAFRMLCGGQMRLIAFVTEGRQIRRILDHIGMDSEPPHIAPARGPPLWDDCGDAQMDDGAQTEPDWATDWDGAAQPVPDFEVDQRINW